MVFFRIAKCVCVNNAVFVCVCEETTFWKGKP